jgi:hypothetical protein
LIIQRKNRAIFNMMIIKSFKNALRQTIGVSAYRKLYRWVYGLR